MAGSTPLTATQRLLVETYTEYAGKCATISARKLSPLIEYDELRSVAYEALIQAAQSFDPKNGGTFGSWAWRRMTGAMLDYQRKLSGQRSGRSTGRHETLDPHERAGRKGQFGSRRIPPTKLTSLDKQIGEEAGTLADVVPDDQDFTERLGDRDEVDRLLRHVPPRERFVVLAIMLGYRMHEVADMLGVTEARISQLHTKAVGRMRMAA